MSERCTTGLPPSLPGALPYRLVPRRPRRRHNPHIAVHKRRSDRLPRTRPLTNPRAGVRTVSVSVSVSVSVLVSASASARSGQVRPKVWSARRGASPSLMPSPTARVAAYFALLSPLHQSFTFCRYRLSLSVDIRVSLPVDVDESLDLELVGGAEEGGQLVLAHVHLAGVHELEDRLQVTERHVLEDDDGVLRRVLLRTENASRGSERLSGGHDTIRGQSDTGSAGQGDRSGEYGRRYNGRKEYMTRHWSGGTGHRSHTC